MSFAYSCSGFIDHREHLNNEKWSKHTTIRKILKDDVGVSFVRVQTKIDETNTELLFPVFMMTT